MILQALKRATGAANVPQKVSAFKQALFLWLQKVISVSASAVADPDREKRSWNRDDNDATTEAMTTTDDVSADPA